MTLQQAAGSFITLKERFFQKESGPSVDFRMVVAILFLLLEGVYHRFSRINLGEPMDLVPPEQDDDKEVGRLKSPQS